MRADSTGPRPSWWRYLRAYVEAIEDGPVTYTAIAKRMGLHRCEVWRLRRRWPQLDQWVHDQLSAEHEQLVGPVLRKMAALGLRGSDAHAALFLKYAGPAPAAGDGPGVSVNIDTGPKIVNLAVPRPGDPPVSASVKTVDATGGAVSRQPLRGEPASATGAGREHKPR